MKRRARLPRSFYARPAERVAKEMLGQVLACWDGRRWRGGRIVETEAYVGEHDLACHASKGRTPRTEVMFGPPARAYVYFVYGMHHCFNVVTGEVGEAQAVLVRALAPLPDLPMDARMDGPARLCRALGITLSDNRADLRRGRLGVFEGEGFSQRDISRGPRIGVDYAGPWADKPLRFWVRP